MSLNRIYQGRVSAVEILKPGCKGKNPDDWQPFDPDDDPECSRQVWREALWKRHEVSSTLS